MFSFTSSCRITTDNSPKAFIFIFLCKTGVRNSGKKLKERNHIFVMDKVLHRPHAVQVVAVGMRHRRYRRMWTVDRQVYWGSQDSRLKQWKWKREFLPATWWRLFWLFSVLSEMPGKGLACWTVKLKLNIDRV